MAKTFLLHTVAAVIIAATAAPAMAQMPCYRNGIIITCSNGQDTGFRPPGTDQPTYTFYVPPQPVQPTQQQLQDWRPGQNWQQFQPGGR